MGGSPDPTPVDNGPMLALIAQMNAQQAKSQADAAAAQKQAIVQGQDSSALQSETQANQAAQQNLGRMNALQGAQDASQLAAAQSAAAGLGGGITGGGIDVNAINSNKMANLGAAGGYLPQTPANMLGVNPKNPAATTAGSLTPGINKGITSANTFTAPNLSNIQFGGA